MSFPKISVSGDAASWNSLLSSISRRQIVSTVLYAASLGLCLFGTWWWISKLKKRYGNLITISQNENIRDDLKNCWCVVGYNSTPNVVAAIEGVPVYVEDPLHSWASDIAFTEISQIENPSMPDRTEWVNKIANIHWSNDEVKSGQLWAAIKNYISSSR